MARVLILFAHPAFERSRINRRLVQVGRTMESVTIRDLYECYPDFGIDVRAEQELLTQNDVVVLQFTTVRPGEQGVLLSVTKRDQGGPGAPRVSVVGRMVTIDLNSNAGNESTAREVVEAINAS